MNKWGAYRPTVWEQFKNVFRLRWQYDDTVGYGTCTTCKGQTGWDVTNPSRPLNGQFTANCIECARCRGTGVIPIPDRTIQSPPWADGFRQRRMRNMFRR